MENVSHSVGATMPMAQVTCYDCAYIKMGNAPTGRKIVFVTNRWISSSEEDGSWRPYGAGIGRWVGPVIAAAVLAALAPVAESGVNQLGAAGLPAAFT